MQEELPLFFHIASMISIIWNRYSVSGERSGRPLKMLGWVLKTSEWLQCTQQKYIRTNKSTSNVSMKWQTLSSCTQTTRIAKRNSHISSELKANKRFDTEPHVCVSRSHNYSWLPGMVQSDERMIVWWVNCTGCIFDPQNKRNETTSSNWFFHSFFFRLWFLAASNVWRTHDRWSRLLANPHFSFEFTFSIIFSPALKKC